MRPQQRLVALADVEGEPPLHFWTDEHTKHTPQNTKQQLDSSRLQRENL